MTWDSTKAAESIFSHAGFDGPKPDSTFARKGFLVFDDANPLKREAYRFPFAEVVEGRLVASADGVRAALAALEQADLPDDVAAKARAVAEHYEAKMPKPETKEFAVSKRGLYEVANLAYVLSSVGSLKYRVDYEEEAEGDEASTAPANLMAAMQALGKALVEMTVEEVGELLSSFDESAEEENERAFEAAFTRSAKIFKRAKLNKTDRLAMETMHEHACRTARLARQHADGVKDSEGASDNAAVIHDRCAQMVDMLRGHIDARSADETPETTEEPKESEEEPEAPKERSVEERKAVAEQLRKAEVQRRAKELIYG